MMSASVLGCRSLTLPDVAGVSPLTCNAASTLRSVTGSRAGSPGFVSGSAKRSTIPNGDAANLASGGMAPVASFRGKLSALRSTRPEASLKSLGSSSVYCADSVNSGLKLTLVTTSAASPLSASNTGLSVSEPDFRRIASASLRGTGALKFRLMGRIGRQADWAFSRSQLKLAENGSRTWKL
ncbi:hypothetical protein D9M73_110370 [compost metagenome]